MDVILKWATILAAASAILAAFSYRHSVRLRRAEWLQKLFQQYYEQERYRKIRYLLDYRPPREIDPLHDRLRADTYDTVVDELWDYLNFFEFVEALVKLRQIQAKDRDYLFGYPLGRIRYDDVICGMLKAQGFERLDGLFSNGASRSRLVKWLKSLHG